jgi:hypothetical protein
MGRVIRDVAVAVAGGFVVAIVVAFTTSLTRTQLVGVFGIGLVACAIVIAAAELAPRYLRGRARLPLKVVPGKPHYHDWNYAATVVALPVKITNRTHEPVAMPGGASMEMQRGDIPDWQTRLLGDDATTFLREIESQRRSTHHLPDIRDRTTIPARATIEAWYVTDTGRDQHGTRPRATLRFKDGDGN